MVEKITFRARKRSILLELRGKKNQASPFKYKLTLLDIYSAWAIAHRRSRQPFKLSTVQYLKLTKWLPLEDLPTVFYKWLPPSICSVTKCPFTRE